MSGTIFKSSDWPIIAAIAFVVGALIIVVGPGFDAFWAGVPGFAKTAVGPFVGAGLAFLFSSLHRRHDERTKDIRAGNLALFLVWTYLSDCYYMRAVLRKETSARVAAFPDTPDWALLRPSLHSYLEEHTFDLDSLAFMLDSAGGRDALVKLQYSERLFGNMKHVHTITTDTLQELQKSTVVLYKDNPDALWEEMEAHIGVELVRRCRDQTRALILRAEKDVEHHCHAFDALMVDLRSRFSSKVWDLSAEPKEKFALDKIPDLPPSIREYIAGLPE